MEIRWSVCTSPGKHNSLNPITDVFIKRIPSSSKLKRTLFKMHPVRNNLFIACQKLCISCIAVGLKSNLESVWTASSSERKDTPIQIYIESSVLESFTTLSLFWIVYSRLQTGLSPAHCFESLHCTMSLPSSLKLALHRKMHLVPNSFLPHSFGFATKPLFTLYTGLHVFSVGECMTVISIKVEQRLRSAQNLSSQVATGNHTGNFWGQFNFWF